MGRSLKEIVEAAATGDARAVRELIEATQGRLFKFCLVLCGDKARAEDLSQDAFIKALANLKKLQKPEAFVEWLFRVTRHLYIDEVRKFKDASGDLESVEAPARDHADIIAVHQTLSQFEAEDRWLLVLVDMENYSYKEAAEIMGVSEDTVRTRLFRLRKAFIEKYKKA